MIDDDSGDGESQDEGEFNEPEGPTETGHYVYQGDELRAGPYPTEEDAQAFIDGHLDGDGRVEHYEAND